MFYKSTQFWWPKFHQATKITLKLCDTCLLFPCSKEALSSSSPQPLAAALYPLFWLPLHVSCSQGGKKPFNGVELLLFVMNMLHSLLSSTRFLRLFYSTLSTGIIKTKPHSIFKKIALSHEPPLTLWPLPASSSVKNPGQKHRKSISCAAVEGGREGDAPASTLGMWHWTLCQGKNHQFQILREKIVSPPSAASRVIVAPAPTPFPSPAAPPFRLQWHQGWMRQYSHMSVTCARAQPIGR